MFNQRECVQCEDYIQNHEFDGDFACPCCYRAQVQAVDFYRDILKQISDQDGKFKNWINDVLTEHRQKHVYANYRNFE